VFLLAAGSVWQMVVPPSAYAVQTDLSFTSAATWTVDPEAARVHVLASITVTSHTADSGGRRYYYDGLQLTLPQGATGFSATSAGEPLGVTVLSASPSGVVLFVSLGQRLYTGQSGTFGLAFDLVDTGGSTDRDLRFGHNLMSFPVSAFGSPGTPGSSVTVLFPPSFTVQEEFGGLTRAVSPAGEVVFSTGTIDDPTALNAWFTAVKPVPATDFSVRSTIIGPLDVTLRYWSDDPGWADQVERVLRAGYPVLRDLIGLGDPIGTSLIVEEASTQELGGFSGAYDQASGQVQISYFADPFVIMHEAAHMWFNSDLFAGRWVNEGFASFYSQQTIDKLGLVGHPPVLTDKLRKAAVPFNDWISVGDPSSTTDNYLYSASMDVAGQIAAIAGQDGLRNVWAAVRAGRAAYQPAGGPAESVFGSGGADWRRLLDLLEQTTGRSYLAIWRGWVVDAAQAGLLTQRSLALQAYAEAQVAAGSWNLSPEIRRSLDDWQFDEATTLIAQARVVLNQHAEIDAAAAVEGIAPPSTLKNAFETVGVAAAGSEATSELAVLSQLAAARQASIGGEGVARALGLIGTDPEANLEAARTAFSGGNLTKALSLATAARSSWEGASDTGQVRVVGALSVLAGLIMLVLIFVWPRRGWLRSGIRTTDAGVTSEAAAAAAIPKLTTTSPVDGEELGR